MARQQLLLLGLLAGLAASTAVYGAPTMGLQMVGYAAPDTISSATEKVRSRAVAGPAVWHAEHPSPEALQCDKLQPALLEPPVCVQNVY